ncbi:MAG: beta galactosidase jelly roll domain-containing protein [Deferribacteres bacterium]|nr:beta galactosidase jelly roll domain-containing protein [candidate division KSB1 bacterium]MCB9503265.1 beta galactosidase jelly roll domain-containing protein [Deferribacteres bacterium]
MKNTKISIQILLLFVVMNLNVSNISANESNPRTRFTINDNWRFFFSDSILALSELPAKGWQQINLPHTWNINDTPTDTSTYRRGIGWYKKQLRLPSSTDGKRIFLHFEGANQISDVYVNEKKVGSHIGGYTAFIFDVSDFINRDDRANTITVRVDNRFNKNVPPLSADFTFYGGIYRDVWLTATNSVHFSLEDYGSNGIYISTPYVSAEKAQIVIESILRNQSNQNENLTIKHTVYSPSGEIKTMQEINVHVKAYEQNSLKTKSITLDDPKLWSPDNPNLYSVQSEIFAEGKLIDRVFNPLGLRWFTMHADSGFFLNGKHLKLVGTNRHQDYKGLGNALPDRLHYNDLKMIKDAGFNFVRLAHYPQDPAVLEAADKLGLIIWEEIPIVNYVTQSQMFADNSATMLKEMLHQHYNHPSIVFWGFMNEIFLHDADGNRNREMNLPDEYLEWIPELAGTLNSVIKKFDPARKTVMAAHHSDLYDKTGLTGITDAMGFNLYQGWYSSKFEHFGEFIDSMHKNHPDRNIIISEYGAGSDERIHSNKPVRFDFSSEYQQNYHESYLKQIQERDYLIATAVWAQNDFGSDRRIDTKAKLNQKGLQYYDRRPKDIYYYYQAALRDKPVVHIASHDWTTRCPSIDGSKSYPFKIYSNFSQLDIFIDGIFFQTFEVDTSNILNFNLQLDIGKHEIEARGKLGNTVHSDHVLVDVVSSAIDSHYAEIAVNVGSDGQFIDATQMVWQNDRPFVDGAFGYEGGEPRPISGSKLVLGTENEPVYQTYREGIHSYSFHVPQGCYEVELCFAEFVHQSAGERMMDIFINGNPAWKGLDLVRDYGYLQAACRKFEVESGNSKRIEIKFVPNKGKTILNGVCIRKK